ncbi:MAG: hypothetical protein K8J31_04505 [Anaerolineae bacterium]|nr:hypothetical protein [Anaerolineae bacterium]
MEIEHVLSSLGFSKPRDVQGRGSIADLFRKSRCGIYVLHFADGAHYVGQAVDVVRRYAQHRQTHKDIHRISFKKVGRKNLNAEERVVVRALENSGFRLRNIQIVSFSYGKTDFDLVMPPSEQQRWLEDLSFRDLAGERLIDDRLRKLYTSKYQKFQDMPEAANVIHVLKEYVQNSIPAIKSSEISFWICSCLPYGSIYSRINIGWQTTFDVFILEGKIFYRWYLTRDLVEQVFGWDLSDINYDLGFTISGFEEYSELVIEIQKSNLTKGGDDQVFVITEGKTHALALIHDEYMLTAVRVFNLGLMQKSPCPWGRFHCMDLADQLVS